ncbi:MAG TPA: hypothetical protein VMB80_08485 [Candidatus Acidoferrum sp.]|nr:hypothetical protein [Candidatus Acidoferrum sp.]
MKVGKFPQTQVIVIAPFLLAGCASPPVTLNPVGPAPVRSATYRPLGELRVFSAVDTHQIGENTCYYPHTGYSIYTYPGKLWKYIPNHVDDVDETPTVVILPPGKYFVKAKANFDVWGTVATTVVVPVVVQEDKLTELHLEADWKAPANTLTNELVYLPGGKPVGWASPPECKPLIGKGSGS